MFEFLFALDWRMQTRIQICLRLYFGVEILAQRPHVGGGIFLYRVHLNLYYICC